MKTASVRTEPRALWYASLISLGFSIQGASATEIAALHLNVTATSSDVDQIVTLLLTQNNLPPGLPVILHPPLGAHLWHGVPDCSDPDHTKTTFQSSVSSEFICLTSRRAQSVRAVASVKLASGAVLVGSSEPIKFLGDPWWKSTALTSGLSALAGAVWGLFTTLFTQNYDRRKKALEEKQSRITEQEQFLAKNLLPELADHVKLLRQNDALAPGQEKAVASLPKKELINLAGEPRAQQLARYFNSLRLKDIDTALGQYSRAAGDYNTAAEQVRRNQFTLEELTQKSQKLRQQLEALGFTE